MKDYPTKRHRKFYAYEGIYIVLDRVLLNSWKLHIAVMILVVIGMFAPMIIPVRLPWALDAAFVGLGFFHIARIIRAMKFEKMMSLKLWQAIMIGVLTSSLIMVCPKINMRTGIYGWYLLFWVNALGAIIAGWNLAMYVERLLMHRKIMRVVSFWLKGVGRNSIVYLCLNQVIILAVMIVLNSIDINKYLEKVLVLIFTMALLFGLEKLICNTKLKVIIGR